MTRLLIPSSLKIGFQNRSSCYTGKLGFITYEKPDCTLFYEKSWKSWSSKDIEPVSFNNVLTEGFVINKNGGGSRLSNRNAFIRVWDPRGWEIEITVENLLSIVETCDIIKGKGILGEFVYGWSKRRLMLIPKDSQDYKEGCFSNNLKDLKN